MVSLPDFGRDFGRDFGPDFASHLAPDLLTLGHYLCGTFDNRSQAMADPVWYVSLQVWHCPTELFAHDSLTIFAEQANTLKLDQPYRQRLMRLQHHSGNSPENLSDHSSDRLTVQFYGFKEPGKFVGAGQNPDRLKALTSEEIEFLPGCLLQVESRLLNGQPGFWAMPLEGSCCKFRFKDKNEDKIGQVSLGFAVSATEFHSYDKGINPATQKPIWGALMGPYQHQKWS